MNNLKVLLNGIVKENPTFVLLLGMCPTLGTTSSAINGMSMGLATMAVLICSNFVISCIKNLVPDMVRIPSYVVVIASLVTVLQMVMQAYVPDLYATLGLFIPLIVVNCIILGRAEAFAAKNGPIPSICPFLGGSKKVETAMGMGAAVAFVLTLATIVTYVIQKFVLDTCGLAYLQTIAFILVIAALVQMVEIILKKVSPALYQALGVFLPLITTNCCILGVTILVIQKDYDLLTGVVYAFSTAIGFALALVVFAGIREQLSLVNIPKGMRGMSIALVTAGLLAMAFMGFSGVDKGLAAVFGL